MSGFCQVAEMEPDIFFSVLKYLDIRDIRNLRHTSTVFMRLIDESQWPLKCPEVYHQNCLYPCRDFIVRVHSNGTFEECNYLQNIIVKYGGKSPCFLVHCFKKMSQRFSNLMLKFDMQCLSFSIIWENRCSIIHRMIKHNYVSL